MITLMKLISNTAGRNSITKLTQSPYLSALDFCNSPVSNIQFDELDFSPGIQ